MSEHIDAILFDMGGTLRRGTDRAFAEKSIMCSKILELTGFESDPTDFATMLNTRANAYRKWSRQEMAELNEIGFWTQWMLPELPAEKVSALAVDLNQIWRNADRIYRVLPDAKETILGLFRAGYRLGLVSNTTSSVEAPDLLEELGVAGWPIWEKEISKFPIDFDETETAYVLEGEIIVTPAGGEPVRILPGDLVVFPEGLDSQWEVVKPLRKHYHYV